MKSKKSEKILIKKITEAAMSLKKEQRGLKIGQLIAMIRSQLGMSQRALAKRSKVPQSNISKIETDLLTPNMSTLQKILDSMECDLLVSAVLRKDPKITKKNQAAKKAKKNIEYLHGTMSLEKQSPNQELLKELVDEEIENLLKSSEKKLWED